MPSDLLSLYIDLEPGEKADLEISSRAALAFAATVREIAGFLDPLSEVRLDLISTTEGSLSCNTKIKFITASGSKEITLYALILTAAFWIGSQVITYVAGREITATWEHFFGSNEVTLSDKDKNEIVEKITKAIGAKIGADASKKIFAELDKDNSVKGVGVSPRPEEKPIVIVPRSDFRRLGGMTIPDEVLPEDRKRKRIETRKVVLVSPVLVPDRKRRWKFRIGEQEFGAPIKDQLFLNDVFSGKHPILVKENVEMTVRLETSEEYINGAWVERDHIVWQVIGVPGQYRGPQGSLPFDDRPKGHKHD